MIAVFFKKKKETGTVFLQQKIDCLTEVQGHVQAM
jgi:hypothetical protein